MLLFPYHYLSKQLPNRREPYPELIFLQSMGAANKGSLSLGSPLQSPKTSGDQFCSLWFRLDILALPCRSSLIEIVLSTVQKLSSNHWWKAKPPMAIATAIGAGVAVGTGVATSRAALRPQQHLHLERNPRRAKRTKRWSTRKRKSPSQYWKTLNRWQGTMTVVVMAMIRTTAVCKNDQYFMQGGRYHYKVTYSIGMHSCHVTSLEQHCCSSPYIIRHHHMYYVCVYI